MKTQYFVYGRLFGSRCSHGTSVGRQTALRLLRKGKAQGESLRRCSYGYEIDVDQRSLVELHSGYRYQTINLAVLRV